MLELSEQEFFRYEKHLQLEGFGLKSQLRLKGATVLLVGMGGLGCPAAQYLAAAGVGHLILMDADHVELGNLQRQILYSSGDVGRLKVDCAVKVLAKINPEIVLTPVPQALTVDNAHKWIQQADIILDGTDCIRTRYLMDDVATALDKPWVYGAIQGYTGQVSVFNYRNGPTYRSLYPVCPVAEEVPGCSTLGVLGVLPGVVGSTQANEVIKILTGAGRVLSGKLWLWDAWDMETSILKIQEPLEKAYSSRVRLETSPGEVSSGTLSISYAQVREMERNQPVLWVDVRDSWEKAQQGIPGSEHWPLSDLMKNKNAPSGWKNSSTVVLCCQQSGRSKLAAEFLQQFHPRKKVHFLEGGVVSL